MSVVKRRNSTFCTNTVWPPPAALNTIVVTPDPLVDSLTMLVVDLSRNTTVSVPAPPSIVSVGLQGVVPVAAVHGNGARPEGD